MKNEMINQNKPAVAVIILNWNGAALLKEYLPQVVAERQSWRLRV